MAAGAAGVGAPGEATQGGWSDDWARNLRNPDDGLVPIAQGPTLIKRYREELPARHYAHHTVDTYEQWLRRFLRFHHLRHPREMGSAEVNAFHTHLAVEDQVSASTQNEALSALLFLYRELLERDLDLEDFIQAWTRPRLPVVMTV